MGDIDFACPKCGRIFDYGDPPEWCPDCGGEVVLGELGVDLDMSAMRRCGGGKERELSDLQPCPFCGGSAKCAEPVAEWDDSIIASLRGVYCVSVTCGARGPERDNDADAIAAWNLREVDAAARAADYQLGWNDCLDSMTTRGLAIGPKPPEEARSGAAGADRSREEGGECV